MDEMTGAPLPRDEDARLAELRRQEPALRATASLSPSLQPADTIDRWRFWPAVVALFGGLLLTALPAFLARGKSEYGDFFRVRPEPSADVVYPIRMVAPEEIARAGVGFDIASTERRRTTAERARDEGRPVMTPPMNFDGRELNVI